MNRDRVYADMADKEEGRDHDVKVAYKDRIVASEGAFGRAWLKFNPGKKLVYVDDLEGRPRAVTPHQKDVLYLALSMIDGEMLTMREMAKRLGVAPSTVSRALTKLQAWGIIAYIVGRGRWAGLVIMRRVKGDGLERLRRAAKARVYGWKLAAEARLSRLQMNVAPYFLDRERVGNDTLYTYLETVTTKSATLTPQPWTVEDLREAGII